MMLSDEEIRERREVLTHKIDLVRTFISTYNIPADVKEDLVQDILGIACTHIAELKSMEALNKWLCKIAQNKALEVAKEYSKRVRTEISWEEETKEIREVLCCECDDMLTINEGFRDEDICEMINSLKPPAPQIIKLRFEEGFSLREIAEYLDIKYNTVKTIENRALKKLKVMMTEERACSENEQNQNRKLPEKPKKS